MITPNEENGETMNEGSDLPPKPGGLCVPVAALALDGTEPAPGDETEVPASIRVTRVENGKAYFEIATINGEAVTDGEAKPEAEPDMMAMAAKADAAMEE